MTFLTGDLTGAFAYAFKSFFGGAGFSSLIHLLNFRNLLFRRWFDFRSRLLWFFRHFFLGTLRHVLSDLFLFHIIFARVAFTATASTTLSIFLSLGHLYQLFVLM